MKGRVRKSGDGFEIRIPRTLARHLGLDDGAEVDLSLVGGRLVVSSAIGGESILDRLVEGITPGNAHDEIEFDPPAGTETW